MTKDTGGPAFPLDDVNRVDNFTIRQHQGMTLRDWFAGQALSGMSGAGPEFMNALSRRAEKLGVNAEEYGARMAYLLADAMIAERSK